MSSTIASTDTTTALKGTYIPRKPSDIRSPCPAVNTLANHGYISRNGRNIRANDLYAALFELGLSSPLAASFAYPPYIELHPGTQTSPPSSWNLIGNLISTVRSFALRPPGQQDAEGVAVLNLDQLDRPSVVEHDVSLTRFDYAQGDNHTPQPELIKNLLAASGNGYTFTAADLVKLRKTRYERQKQDNPALHFEATQNQIACAEIALLLKVLGNGTEVPVSHIKAFFEDERLPREEGWKRRVWWSLGIVELGTLTTKVKGLVGDIWKEQAPATTVAH